MDHQIPKPHCDADPEDDAEEQRANAKSRSRSLTHDKNEYDVNEVQCQPTEVEKAEFLD